MSFEAGDLVVINHFRKYVVGMIYKIDPREHCRHAQRLHVYLTTCEAVTRRCWECHPFTSQYAADHMFSNRSTK